MRTSTDPDLTHNLRRINPDPLSVDEECQVGAVHAIHNPKYAIRLDHLKLYLRYMILGRGDHNIGNYRGPYRTPAGSPDVSVAGAGAGLQARGWPSERRGSNDRWEREGVVSNFKSNESHVHA